jgi:hypothetical protein
VPSVLIPSNRVPLSAYAGRQHPSRPAGSGWSGLPGDLRQWAGQVVEKVRVASVGGRLRFLPWFDPYTEETPEMRAEYRHMLREPSIKAAVQTKALSVISEEIQFQPEDDDDPRQQEAAQFLSYAFRHVSGGTRQLGWSVLLAAIIDGHSVCEKVWCPEPLVKGRFKGKRIFHAVKCKDTHFLQLGIDPYRNLTALKGTGFNAGRVWSPSDFVTFSYFSLFENPAGMSDFRAAYRAYWIKDTTWKLRSLHLEKWTGPFITGQYASQEQKAALEAAFEEARASTWLTIPAGAVVEAMDLAMKGTSDFKDAIQDCDREMLIAIVGAHLQILEGQTGGARGNTKIHKEIGELIQWWLAATLADVYQQQLAVPLIEENYHDVEVPACTVGAITDEDILGRAKVYEAVQKIGVKLSKKAVYRNLSLQPPDPGDPDDTLEPPGQGGGGPAVPPTPAGPEGGGEGDNPFAEARRFCQEGPNKGKPGPCPEDVDRHHVAATAHHAAARAAHKEAAKHSRAAAATTEKRTGDPLRDVPRWASKDLDEIQQLAGGGAGKSDPQKLSQAVTRADQLLSRLEPLADTNPGAARAAEKLRATRDAARRALASYTAAHESRQAARQAQAGREAPLQEAVDRHAAVLTSGDDWGTILEGDLYGPDVNALESALRDFEHVWKPREQKEAAGRVKKTAAAVAAAHAGQAEHAASVAAARNLALAASRLLPALDELEAVRRHAEGWQAFCQEGPNKGKPGPCPEGKGDGPGAAPRAGKARAGKKRVGIVRAWLRSRGWTRRLSGEQKQAAQDYVDNSGPVNRPLWEHPDDWREALTGKAREDATALHDALEKAPTFLRPLTVWRGVQLFGKEPAFMDACREALAGGHGLQMAGFLSTTFDAEIAQNFSVNVVLEIEARKGAYLSGVGGREAGQSELLLQHNSVFEVAGIETATVAGEGRTIVRLRHRPGAEKSARVVRDVAAVEGTKIVHAETPPTFERFAVTSLEGIRLVDLEGVNPFAEHDWAAMSEADWQSFAAADWTPYTLTRGPNKGKQVWKNQKTGAISHEDPTAKAKQREETVAARKKAQQDAQAKARAAREAKVKEAAAAKEKAAKAKQQAAAKQKQAQERAVTDIGAMISGEKKPTAAAVKQAAAALLTMTGDQLRALKKQVGAKGGGRAKAELVRIITERAKVAGKAAKKPGKGEVAVKTDLTAVAPENPLLQAAVELEPDFANEDSFWRVDFRHLRGKFPGVGKEEFDRSVLALANAGAITLTRNNFPDDPKTGGKENSVTDGQGNYFVGMTLDSRGTTGKSLAAGLRGGPKPPKPGFTGTDTLGRRWANGKLVAKEEQK